MNTILQARALFFREQAWRLLEDEFDTEQEAKELQLRFEIVKESYEQDQLSYMLEPFLHPLDSKR